MRKKTEVRSQKSEVTSQRCHRGLSDCIPVTSTWDMLELLAGRKPGICELRSPLDKLKHVPQRGKAASCKRPAFNQIDARSRVPRRSETFWRYVGQDGNLRRVGNQVGNPPLSGTGPFIGRPIANRPQDAILPYIADLEPQRAGGAIVATRKEY